MKVVPAIELDFSGPVFLRQTWIGKNGRKFTFYKFRSMYVDAEEWKKELMEQDEVQGLMFKMENEPRITRVENSCAGQALTSCCSFGIS